jgi:hypothetical protein
LRNAGIAGLQPQRGRDASDRARLRGQPGVSRQRWLVARGGRADRRAGADAHVDENTDCGACRCESVRYDRHPLRRPGELQLRRRHPAGTHKLREPPDRHSCLCRHVRDHRDAHIVVDDNADVACGWPTDCGGNVT